jgi:uncharacterized protein YqeY
MSLHQTIKADVKVAMIAKNELNTLVLRGVLAAFQTELIAQKSAALEVADEVAITIIKKLVKQRKDSIDQFTKGGRPELAEIESNELVIIEKYLPATMSHAEIHTVVLRKQAELMIVDKSKMGLLIGAVSKELKGKAEGSDIKVVVEKILL